MAHPRAVRRHPPGGADFAARLAGRTVTGGPPPRQVPVARPGRRGPTGDDAVLAHLGMSGQMLVADPGRAGREAPADPASGSPTTGRSCGSSTSARSAGCRCTRWCRRSGGGLLPAADRAHRPRPDGPGVRPRRRGGRACAAGAPGSSARCWTRPWSPASATSTPTRRSGGPGCTAPGPPSGSPGPQGRAVLAAASRGDGRGAGRGRHLVRRAVRQRQRGVGLLRPLAGRLRAGRPAVPALRHPDPPRPVHEPQQLHLPALPAPPPHPHPDRPRHVITTRRDSGRRDDVRARAGVRAAGVRASRGA